MNSLKSLRPRHSGMPCAQQQWHRIDAYLICHMLERFVMNNRLSTIGIVCFVLLSAVQPLAAADHSKHLKQCAKTCAECQTICDSCYDHCLSLLAEGKKEHEQTARLCADCAECCKTCATLCARQSPLAKQMLECCQSCCEECAQACEKFKDDKHMAECAKSCRECAKECKAALAMIGK